MDHYKNFETVSAFIEVMQKKNCGLFFPDMVYFICARVTFQPFKVIRGH